MKNNYNIKEYGALGDGVAKDTRALQSAVDDCGSAGGGTVYVSAGTYLCGTIWLKSKVELHLAPGAVIKGSPDKEDYNKDESFAQNAWSAAENWSGAHLLIALEAENVAITGQGTIDGNGLAFYDTSQTVGLRPVFRAELIKWRPGQMIYFCECKNVLLRDVQLVNSPTWNLFLHGCERIKVEGLNIRNDRRCCTGDGIDIDCSRDVSVSNCSIDVNDDCITLRANNRKLKNREICCENVTVTNCVLKSRTAAIRVGVGDGRIRNCLFDNIVVHASRGILFSGRYSESHWGAEIENIRFSNFTMATSIPFCILAGYEGKGPLKNVYFAHIKATADCVGFIGGTPDNRIAGIHFDDIEIVVSGGKENSLAAKTPIELWARKEKTFFLPQASRVPHVFYIFYGADITFRNVRINWKDIDGVWTSAFLAEDCAEIAFSGAAIAPPPGEKAEAAICCKKVGEVRVENCRALPGTVTFLGIADSPPGGKLILSGNDFSCAQKVVEIKGSADLKLYESGNIK